MVTIGFRVLIYAALVWSVHRTHKWIRDRSRLLSVFFATGLIIRVLSGLALFYISRYHLPILTSLQLGDGFWTFALDGRNYYEVASQAVAHGLFTISDTAPSPLYLRVLAAWMWTCGVSPASAMLLNAVCYAIGAGAIVAVGSPRDRPSSVTGTAVGLAAITFSPALLIFGTQPLKDPLCTTFIIVIFVGARLWWMADGNGRSYQPIEAVAGALLVAVGIYGVSGIRAYVALFVLVSFTPAALYGAVEGLRSGSRARAALREALLLCLLCGAFFMGAGPYGVIYEWSVLSATTAPSQAIGLFDTARAGFVESGGATSLEYGRPRPPSVAGRIGQVARGYVVLFVPISLLRAVSFVKFSGGGGLLPIIDVDTVVIDASVVTSLYLFLLFARRNGISSEAVFVLLFTALMTASLAYVVTNYGTLFRLRLLGVAPFWILPVVMRGAGSAPWRPHGTDKSQSLRDM
jgi:hypothetical protein